MPYQNSVTSFTSREVLDILHRPDWSRVIREPPVKPRAGEVFLFHYKDDSRKDDWRCDQYHFQHDGIRKQPRADPKFYKNFFVLRTSRGKDKRFRKHAYVLMRDHNNLVLFQYLGDESVAVDLPHGNSKDASNLYTRLCPSVIQAIKDITIKPRDILQHLQEQAQTSAVSKVKTPRSLSQISNTRCREKGRPKKVKEKRRKKKKRVCQEVEQDNPTAASNNLTQEHLVSSNHGTEGDIPPATDVMSPQSRLNELAELCETIYQENMAGQPNRVESCDDRMCINEGNVSGTESQTCSSMQSAESNAGHVFSGSTQQLSQDPATTSVMEIESADCVLPANNVNIDMANLSNVVEMEAPQNICLIIQDGGVSSSGTVECDGVTDSVESQTLDNIAETGVMDVDVHATGSNGDTLQPLKDSSVAETTHGSMECFFETQNTGQLTDVIALMKETLKTEVEFENKELTSLSSSESACSQTLPVIYIGKSTSQDKTPLPETAVSLIAQVSRLWARVFQGARQLILKSDSPGRDTLNNVSLIEALAAVIVGAYEIKSDCLTFLETLKVYPCHLLRTWIEKRATDVDPDARYRIGNYTISGSDILRLEGTSWLDDSVLHAYLYLVQKQHSDARTREVRIMECFHYKLWERQNYSEWLQEKIQLRKYDLVLMPICINSHWVLLAANVLDRTVCVINSKPSKDLETEVTQHWMKYMEYRSQAVEEELRSWKLVQCPVFPQTDGSSCGVFVLMAAEALAAGVAPGVMRNCHVAGYRQYVKQRLMLAAETTHAVEAPAGAAGENTDPEMLMGVSQAEDQAQTSTDVSGRVPPEMLMGVSQAEDQAQTSTDVSGRVSPEMLMGVSQAGDLAQTSTDVSGREPPEMLMGVSQAGDLAQTSTDVSGREPPEMLMGVSQAGDLAQTSTDVSGRVPPEMLMGVSQAEDQAQTSTDVSGRVSPEMLMGVSQAGDQAQTSTDVSGREPPEMLMGVSQAGDLAQTSTDVSGREPPEMLMGVSQAGDQAQTSTDVSGRVPPEMLMGVSQTEDQAQTSTDVSGRVQPEMLMGVSQAGDLAQTSTDVSGREPPIMDCEMNEDENVKSSEEMLCVSLSRGPNVDPSVGELDHAALDATGLDEVEKTGDRNVSVDSSIQSVDETEAGEEDMKVVTADNNAQDQPGPMESGTYVDDSTMSCEHPLDHVPLQSQCEALFKNQKSNFTALTLLCLEKGKLKLSDLDGPAEDCSLQMHMKWACQLTRTDAMSGEQFRQCLHSLSGSLLRSQGSVVQLRHEQIQSHIEEILMTTAVEYINDVDPLFIYRHVKVQGSRDSLSNGKGLTLYLDKNRQKDLGLRFVGEIEKHNFAFSLTHQACGKHTFASMVIRMCTATGNVKEHFKICDKIHGGNFLSWMCFGKNAELYKVLSSYIPDEERKECVIPCCVSGNSEILQLLLEDMELDGLLSSTPRLQVVHGIDSCQGQPESLPSHHLPPLHLASYYGHTDIVQLLLQHGCDVNLQLQPQGDEAGQVAARSTPAAVAAQRGHTGVLKCLIESNADLNLVDCKLNTPLHLACEAGHGGIVLILANVCKICSRNKDGNTPVHLACQEGRTDVVDILLKRNADLTMLNFDNCSPIDVVCSNGYSSVLQLLLNRISYPLPCDGYKTPLHTACKNGYRGIVNILLQHDAGRSVCTDRNTPLEMAVKNNHTTIVSALLGSGTNNYINTQYLILACQEGHTDIVTLLIEKGADVFAVFFDGFNRYTPLSWACKGGHTDIVKLLIEKGADVSAAAAAAADGYTPLSWACRGGHTDIVKLLIENGADVSAPFHAYYDDYDGYTPLSWACKEGHTAIVKLLIEKGADVSAADDYGDTPLSLACKEGHTDIVKLLIEKGTDVSAAADDDGYTPLSWACRGGHTDIVKQLIENGADVSAPFHAYYDDYDGYTPLSWACKEGHTDIVKLLIENGADVSAASADGYTPLSCACKEGHTDIVKLLIEKGTDVSAAAAAGDTPLSWACKEGHTDIVKLLIEKGADVSAAAADDDDGDDGSYTPLPWACRGGHTDIVKLLIEKGADVSAAADDGDTPLTCACRWGHTDIVKLLIENGADVSAALHNYDDYDGDTPLSCALWWCHTDIVKLLIEKGADVSADSAGGYTPLSWACKEGHTDIVKLLIEKGTDVSAASAGGDTPLSWACKEGHTDIVKLLIEKGADVSAAAAADDDGDDGSYTPVSWACRGGHTDIVKLLIENGADVSAAAADDDDGSYTPLSWACRGGHTDIVKLPIEKGADVSAADGFTPLSWACRWGHTDIVKLLIEKGADVSAADDDGDTPLSCACRGGHTDIVKLLIENGADVSAALHDNYDDYDGDTPLSWACKEGHTDIVKLLIEKGADVSAADGNGDTPLSCACRGGHTDIVKLLIEKGTDVSAAAAGGDTPLSCACREGHTDTVKLLIEKGADVSDAAGGDTPLSCACREGHTDTVKLLIEKGADVSDAAGGDTPLSCACREGHTDIVKLLIEKGADVSDAAGGDTPLVLACREGHTDIVKLLIEKGTDVSAVAADGYTPLSWACRGGHTDIVKLLIEKGADVSAADDDGYTPLSCACRGGHTDIVKLLIERGANVSAAADGYTPLLLACENGHIDIVKLFKDRSNISVGCFHSILKKVSTEGKREVASVVLKEVLPRLIVPFSNYCHTLIEWCSSSDHLDIVKDICDKSDEETFPGMLISSLLEKAVANGDAYGVELLKEYMSGVVSNDRLLSLMSKAAENRHIAVFQILHSIPHDHDSSDNLVQKACHYGLVQVCNVLLRCGCTHSGTCLTEAVKVKNVVLAELLLSHGVDVNARDDDGNTSLHLACEVGEWSLVETFIAKGIHVSQTNKRLETPLFIACRYGYVNVAKLLLSHGADITKQDINGNTVLHSVSMPGHEVLLQLSLHYIWMKTDNGYHDQEQERFLNCKCVRDFLHCRNNNGETPLHIACREKRTGVLKSLLQYKASVFVTDNDGHTPVYHAMKLKTLFRVLCTVTCDINGMDSDGNTILHMACMKGDVESVDILCGRGACVLACNKNQECALHKSAENGNEDIMNILLAQQADVNMTDTDKQTPLHIACAEGHLKIVELLVKSKVDVNVPDKHLLVPLHLACRDGQRNIADALIKSSADIAPRSKKRDTPLSYACEGGHIGCVALLLENGACANLEGYRGNTPLHKACIRGHENVVRLLLSCGADPMKVNNNGKLPLHHAVLWGNLAIVNMLLHKTKHFLDKTDNIVSLFEQACSRGHDDIVKRLIDFIPDNSMSSPSMTSLVATVISAKHSELLPVLADNGLNIKLRDEFGRNALHILCESEDSEMDSLEKVSDLGFDLTETTEQGGTMLHVVSKVGNIELVDYLIGKGINVQAKDTAGDTALHAACAHGHFQIAQVLIKKGLSINEKNIRAMSPLDLAIVNKHYGVTCMYDLWCAMSKSRPRISMTSLHHICRDNKIQLLYNSEVMFAEKDSDGNSALHIACIEGSEEIVQLLIIAGAWLFVLDTRGDAPVHVACRGSSPCLKAMMDAILNRDLLAQVLSLRDKSGNVPLHIVTFEQNLQKVCILLDKHVDIEIVTNFDQTALHIACYGGNFNIVAKLIGAGASILAVDKSGNTPLHIVCKEGNLPLLMLMNNKDAAITAKNYEGRTPLHEAVNHEHYDMTYYMMTAYCHFPTRDLSVLRLQQFIKQIGSEDFIRLIMAEKIDVDPYGNTPLHFAAETGSLDFVNTLIRRGYNCDSRNRQGRTPLFHACSSGSTNIAKLILQRGSSSSVSDSNNMTPLHTASERGHVDVVKLLLEYDHNLQAKTNEGQTALHLSCLAGQKDVTEVLLKAGSDMNALDNGLETPLHLAARSGAGDVMVLQAKWGARDTQCNVHGNTALHIACGEGHADAVKALLNMGSDILATNKLEKTPLMLACERQHGSILELLLRRSWVQIQVQCLQDKNQGDLRKKMYVNNLNHCLCVACKYNYLNTVKVLLKYDVNINHGSNITRDMPEGSCTSRTDRCQMETESGGQLQTPLHISCYEGHAECVALLIQARALLEARIASGDTPLHVACEQGKEGPLELLIANGASPSPVNANNSTPLHYACQGGYEGIVWRLLEAGADLDIRDVHGKSPLEVCSSQGVKDVILKRCGRKRRQEAARKLRPPHTSYQEYNPDSVLFMRRQCMCSSLSFLSADTNPAESLIDLCCSWYMICSGNKCTIYIKCDCLYAA